MEEIIIQKNGPVAYVTLHSPPANALSMTMLEKLSRQLDEIENNEHIKVVIMKGEGSFFCAGANINELHDYKQQSDYVKLSTKGQRVFERIEQFSIPVIAAIHGAALGGGLELAMACHIRVATRDAKLGLPELSLGVIPGFAGTQRLPKIVGFSKAYELLLTAEALTGEEAHYYRLVDVVVDEPDLLQTVGKMATLIGNKSKPTIQSIMQLLLISRSSDFSKGCYEESVAFGEVFSNQDAKEGMKAFLEKRQPHFNDK